MFAHELMLTKKFPNDANEIFKLAKQFAREMVEKFPPHGEVALEDMVAISFSPVKFTNRII